MFEGDIFTEPPAFPGFNRVTRLMTSSPSTMSDLLVKPLADRIERLEKARETMKPLLAS